MNERIEKIAHEQGIPWDNKYHWYVSNTDLKRFAELIVQECIDCVRGAVLTDEVAVKNNLGFNDGLSAAVVNVQKHFGVEE
jgi:hypothetical protein